MADGEKAILATEDEAEVDKVIEDAAGKVSELKTDAQYTKEEEAAAAAAAAARSSSSRSSGGGCVGGGSSAFY